MFWFVLFVDVRQSELKEPDYLMCIREHEDQKFLQYISGVNSEKVFQLVHRHVPADLKGKMRQNV